MSLSLTINLGSFNIVSDFADKLLVHKFDYLYPLGTNAKIHVYMLCI